MLVVKIWKPIIKNGKSTGYDISSAGDIRNKHGHKLALRYRNYIDASLFIDGKNWHPAVHRLVAKAFIPNPDNLPEVNHKDGNKHNNIISNLEWVTRDENMQHAWSTGLNRPQYGETNGSNKYTESQIKMVCELLSRGGYRNKDITKITGVPISTINEIANGRSWVGIREKYDIKKRANHIDRSMYWNDIDNMILKGYRNKDIIKAINIPESDKKQIKSIIKSRRAKLRNLL